MNKKTLLFLSTVLIGTVCFSWPLPKAKDIHVNTNNFVALTEDNVQDALERIADEISIGVVTNLSDLADTEFPPINIDDTLQWDDTEEMWKPYPTFYPDTYPSDFYLQWTSESNTFDKIDSLLIKGISVATNGYIQLLSGLIIQWGYDPTSAINDIVLAHTITYPHECFVVYPMAMTKTTDPNGGATSDWICSIKSMTTTNFVVFKQRNVTDGIEPTFNPGVKWISIGH